VAEVYLLRGQGGRAAVRAAAVTASSRRGRHLALRRPNVGQGGVAQLAGQILHQVLCDDGQRAAAEVADQRLVVIVGRG